MTRSAMWNSYLVIAPFQKDSHPGYKLNNFRSIEYQIMDWADDTAFSISGFADGIRAGFINAEKVDKWG